MEDRLGSHTFETNQTHSWLGEVMLRVLSFYGSHYYCSLSQIAIYGIEEPEELMLDDDDEVRLFFVLVHLSL